MADKKEFKPTYVARVEISKNKYRYFYTQAEYKAYLNGKNKTKEGTPTKTDVKKEETKTPAKKSLLSNLFGGLKKAASSISNTVKKVSSALAKTVKNGAEAVENTLKKVGSTNVSKAASSDAAKTGEKIVSGFTGDSSKSVNSSTTVTTDKVENGKTSTDKALEKLSDEPVGSITTAAVAAVGAKTAGALLGGFIGGLFIAAVTAVAKAVKNVVSAVAQKIQERKDKETAEEEAKKAEEDRRAKLSDEYNKFLDSEPPKSFDELKHLDDHHVDPDSWDGVYDNMLDVNENYAEANGLVPPDPGATQNCANCTAAYDLRCRGYDVEAGPYDPNDPPTTISEIISWYDNPTVEVVEYDPYPTDKKGRDELGKQIDAVTSDLLKQGNGARGHFVVNWANGGAHDVVYEVRNDQVYLLDCQNGNPYTVNELMCYSNTVTYFRTDNIGVNDKVLSRVRNDDDGKPKRPEEPDHDQP